MLAGAIQVMRTSEPVTVVLSSEVGAPGVVAGTLIDKVFDTADAAGA